MKVGVTGSSRLVTRVQREALASYLARFGGPLHELHHGDCIDADAEAHEIALSLGMSVVIHPPENPKKRAWCEGGERRPPAPYHVRNHAIVDETDCLIAVVDGAEQRRRRAGEWATVRYARRMGKPVTVILWNGEVVVE